MAGPLRRGNAGIMEWTPRRLRHLQFLPAALRHRRCSELWPLHHFDLSTASAASPFCYLFRYPAL